MLTNFEKDVFQRILANYRHNPADLQCRIDDLCADCSRQHAGLLFHQLCFYARFYCMCYEDATSRFFPIAHQMWMRAKSLSELEPKGSIGIADCFRTYFHDLVWRFVTMVSAHQDWFEDITVMNQLKLPFSGWVGVQDFTYHDHFGSVNYPKSHCSTESESTNPFILSGDSYTRNAWLLSFPTSLFSYFEDHVEATIYLESDFQSDTSIAICGRDVKGWLQRMLQVAYDSHDEWEIPQIENLLANIEDHVRRIKLQISY